MPSKPFVLLVLAHLIVAHESAHDCRQVEKSVDGHRTIARTVRPLLLVRVAARQAVKVEGEASFAAVRG